MIKRVEPDWIAPFATPLGLPSFDALRDLGAVVVLAGPNGSGKSRFLAAMQALLQQAIDVEALARQGTTASQMEIEFSQPKPEGLPDAPRRKQIAALRFREANSHIKNFGFCDLSQPSNLTVQDASSTGAGDHDRCVRGCGNLGLRAPYEYQHVYLDAVARQLELQNRTDRDQYQGRINHAESFNSLLGELLGANVVPVLNTAFSHDAKLFDRSFAPTELSSGQKVLIAWAIALHAQADLCGSTVFVDEPENHLHPDACLRALEGLRKRATREGGQIWIATHSVPIIAWAGASSLYSVAGGAVSYAGKQVQGVIDTLCGGGEQRESLRDFLAEADHFGFYHFIGQCLARPGVVGHAAKSDPQAKAFGNLVASVMRNGQCRVLDFGAGKGRLADAIARIGGDLTSLSYYMYDPDREFRGDRVTVAQRLNDAGGQAMVLDELGPLRVAQSEVDLVVLCNVLHEIPHTEWLGVISSVTDVLTPTGKLAIIEDQEPSIGELPHNKGFILLNNNEVAQLFGGHAYVVDSSPGPQVSGGRISVFCIDRQNLANANEDTLKKALRDLGVRAKHEVDRLRRESSGQRDGRRHALYMVLAYNALRATE
jgi:energy-coupling factor transporter ATP-binding protein EcfA2/SAM-dependent methyltransferase